MKNEKILNILSSLLERYSETKENIRKGTGLTAAEFKALLCLEIDEEISCQDLSVRMHLSVSRGSRVIEGLFKKGYLERTDNPTDRRCKNVWLTDSGVLIRKRIETQTKAYEEKLTADIPPYKLKNIKAELKNLLNKF